MHEVRTKLDIAAPPALVWEVLLDFPSYARWNPLIVELSGDAAKNATLKAILQRHDGKRMEFHPKVLVCQEKRELRWLGTFIGAWLFAGEHFFELEAIKSGTQTRFIHGEIFTGLLVDYFAGGLLKGMPEAFAAMNEAFKQEVEKRAEGLPPPEPEALPQTGTRLGAILR